MTTPTNHLATHDQTARQPAESPRALRSAWISPWVLASIVLIALVYGSLIPFGFDGTRGLSAPRFEALPTGQSSIGVPFAFSDLIVNLLLYVPLGITLRLALRRRRWGVVPEVLATVLVCLCVSFGVELLQGLMPARVASLNDVAMNTAGGLVGAGIAVVLWRLTQRIAFGLYCKLAVVHDRLRRILAKPGIAMALAGGNALVIGIWYIGEVGRSTSDADQAALPFERAFALPYDLGALLLGEAMLVYAGLGCLLLVLTYTGTRRLAMNWVVLGVVVLAFAAELTRALTHNAIPDVTGVLLALAAASIMTVTVYSFTHAVRRRNRRHSNEPFDGPERRRRVQDIS